jgi:hypothetical protein
MVETKNTIDVRLGIKIKFWLQQWICDNKIFISLDYFRQTFLFIFLMKVIYFICVVYSWNKFWKLRNKIIVRTYKLYELMK